MEKPEPFVELGTATIEQLIDELKSRSDVLFVVLTPSTPEDFDWGRYYKGHPSQILWYMERAKHDMMQRDFDAHRDLDDEPEDNDGGEGSTDSQG